ncbi:short chain dehydrogenase [Hirsutella rhossiliensis]|uniref:Short chain dehydrogenase domain-containing protein n=1 Tax=Hirsutella rhossiliensis TaxID=111463 RepID=A0A9P8N1Q7_9HYPO|nr:short chain dehydrogenase domain-containing protein [Hirsutella rhossiliensis]KAH0965259.1 short chain dehydrogenase domain-containing protein [Hirsutella rhossiliensis]
MAIYLITGANRGVGLEFVRQYSSDAKNTVVGLVRDKDAAEKNAASLFSGQLNVHFIEAELTKYESLKKAAAQTSRITGGKLDYVIANAAIVSEWSAFSSLEELGRDPDGLEQDLAESFNVNVIGNINLFNLFLPLVRKGGAKKVITISSGMADLDLINNYDLELAGPYTISKAAMNAAVAKYSAVGRKEGILFMSISPGVVETGHHSEATEEQLQRVAEMGKKFATYAPHFTRPLTPEESVTAIREVIVKASIEAGSAGSFVSHLGNQQWL